MDLLERDRELGLLRAALAGAAAGQSSGVAVTGDSGTGKSALIETARNAAAGLRQLRGSCDPLRTPRPLGPFRDIARDLGVGPLLRGAEVPLATMCEELYDALRTEATVLVVEDLHWVDAASVDVLRFLAHRVESMPLALVVSYRDHEIGPRHSARPLLGDFARLEGLSTIQLGPLTVDGVRRLVGGTRLDPVRVHALTGGNPFFVTEVAKEPDRTLPLSVRDAVLSRTADVAAEDFDVLQLVATAPDRLDDRVLPALGVDLPTLRRLDMTGLLTRTHNGLVFRHELARQAVESTIPLGGAPRLHARLLQALEQIEPREPAILTHHAVAARDSVRATRYAQEAAREAIQAGAHSEAAAFYATALEHLDGAAPAERAELMRQLSFEQYMTSRLAEAIENIRATFPLWQRVGDAAGLAEAHETCATFEYYNAHRSEAVAQVERAARIACESSSDAAYAAARATRGYLAYQRNEGDLALACAEDAGQIAQRQASGPLVLRSQVVQALVALVSGDLDARARLADHIETARENAWDELASTGYSQLASIDVEHHRLRSAERVLDESLPFTVTREIPICNHWQMAVRSRLHFAQGRWNAALEDADRVLDDDGMPLARLWPHVVTALVALRRGDRAAQTAHLETAWELAGRIDEPLRWLPVLSALAETAWMTGRADPRVSENAVAWVARLAREPASAWGVGDLALWLHRLELLAEPPDGLAEPFRLAFEGRAAEAASWWHRAGEPFAEAMAWSDSPEPEHRTRGVELLDELGAIATADRHRVALRRDGVARVPQRPRVSTRANPAGLTNRQLDVAKLVARGFTNAEIATRLYISPKTADHHVSSVLTKLGLPNRRAVVVQADELGLA